MNIDIEKACRHWKRLTDQANQLMDNRGRNQLRPSRHKGRPWLMNCRVLLTAAFLVRPRVFAVQMPVTLHSLVHAVRIAALELTGRALEVAWRRLRAGQTSGEAFSRVGLGTTYGTVVGETRRHSLPFPGRCSCSARFGPHIGRFGSESHSLGHTRSGVLKVI